MLRKSSVRCMYSQLFCISICFDSLLIIDKFLYPICEGNCWENMIRKCKVKWLCKGKHKYVCVTEYFLSREIKIAVLQICAFVSCHSYFALNFLFFFETCA